MNRLEVTVVRATNLKQKDKLKENDSFIRIYCNKQKQKTTTTIKESNDPKWNEVFIFKHLKRPDILYMDVYGEDEKIGSCQIKLHKLYKKGHIDDWFHIPAKVGLACYGQVHLILNHSTE